MLSSEVRFVGSILMMLFIGGIILMMCNQLFEEPEVVVGGALMGIFLVMLDMMRAIFEKIVLFM